VAVEPAEPSQRLNTGGGSAPEPTTQRQQQPFPSSTYLDIGESQSKQSKQMTGCSDSSSSSSRNEHESAALSRQGCNIMDTPYDIRCVAYGRQ
jgi:hypothetical protein